jgi:hypothetical protein
VGEARFKLGVTAAIDRHATGFFPTVGEFLPFIPSVANKEFVTCPVCENSSGYVIVKVMKMGKFTEVAAKCKHGGE